MEKPLNSRLETGKAAEAAAEQHLMAKGYRLVCRNYRCRRGEIDLVMTKGDQLAFIEVRCRNRGDFGGALQSVTTGKQRKIIATARYFLLNHPRFAHYAIRFDVIAARYHQEAWSLDWIPAAFLAE